MNSGPVAFIRIHILILPRGSKTVQKKYGLWERLLLRAFGNDVVQEFQSFRVLGWKKKLWNPETKELMGKGKGQRNESRVTGLERTTT